MNVNAGMSGNNLNFGRVLVSTEGMGKTAAKLAEKLEQEIEYSSAVSDLDDMGVDVVIISDPENREDGAKVLFATRDDHLYKIDNKDHIKTGKKLDIGMFRALNAWDAYIGIGHDSEGQKAINKQTATDYSTNSEAVLDAAQKIVDGEITRTTKRMTKSVREMLEHFRVR